MKAIVLSEYGDSSHLKLAEIPEPKPGAGEIKVKEEIRRGNTSQVGPVVPFPSVSASWSFFNCFSAARRARGVSGAAMAPFVATTQWPNRVA